MKSFDRGQVCGKRGTWGEAGGPLFGQVPLSKRCQIEESLGPHGTSSGPAAGGSGLLGHGDRGLCEAERSEGVRKPASGRRVRTGGSSSESPVGEHASCQKGIP